MTTFSTKISKWTAASAMALFLSVSAMAATNSVTSQEDVQATEGTNAGYTCSACQTDINSCHQSYGVTRHDAAQYALQDCQMFGDCYIDSCWPN